MNIAIMCVVAVACVLLGKLVGSKLGGVKKDVDENMSVLRRAAQQLAIVLREHGLKRLPEILEEMVVGDVKDLFKAIIDLAMMLKGGNEAIVKELEGTFERCLVKKLGTPEGRAVLKARLLEAEKIAAPIVAAVVVAAI